MDIHPVLDDFSNVGDFGDKYSNTYSNTYSSKKHNYGGDYGNCYRNDYKSDYKNMGYCKNLGDRRRRDKRQDDVDGLLETRLASLMIGEAGDVHADRRSTAPDERVPISSPDTAQEASTKSLEHPTSAESGGSDGVKNQSPRNVFDHSTQSPSSSSDFESLHESSCTTPEPASDDETDQLGIRPAKLSDSEIFVKPKLPEEFRLLVDDGERDDIDEQDARVRSALRFTKSRQEKGGWGSIPPSPSLCQSRSRPKKSKANGSLLACPYTKHDNATQEQLYRCRRIAFHDTHRLKEHLYRVHRQKPHCTRCGETFPSRADLEPHSRLQEVCNIAEVINIEGFTPAQEDELKSKKRKRNLKTEEDKWKNIFRILFPDCTKMPDPYYHVAPDSHSTGGIMDQSDVESIFADDVPSELEERTFSRLEAISGRLDDEQRREVKSIFKDFASERVRQITESTDSVTKKEENTAEIVDQDTEHPGVPHPEKASHTDAINDEAFIGIAAPKEVEERILSVLDPESVHEDVLSEKGPSAVPSESENDILESALAAWNEAAINGWDHGWTKDNSLNRLVSSSQISQSEVPNLPFDCNFIDDYQFAGDDNRLAFNPVGGFSSRQGAWNGSFAH